MGGGCNKIFRISSAAVVIGAVRVSGTLLLCKLFFGIGLTNYHIIASNL